MSPSAARRMYLVLGALLFIFVAYAFRSAQLQTVLAQDHLSRGDWQSVTAREIEAPRGSITDRDGRELAQSVVASTLIFDPQFYFLHEADQSARVIELLSRYDGFDLDRFNEWASSSPADVPQYAVIERRLPPAEADDVIAQLQAVGVDSVYTVPEYRRIYPYRDLAGHTIGYLQGDGTVGLSGIERSFDSQLRGGTVSYEVTRDHERRAYLLGDVPDPESARGGTVVLSIDAQLQRFVEDALAQTVDYFEAEMGTVIVSRPDTGEILSMASYPSFDPNVASAYPVEATQNPATAHAFEPGSTAKIFTFAAALDHGLVEFAEPIDCERGRVFIGGHWVEDTHSEDVIPAWEVMQVSSNIGMLRIGMRMPQEVHRQYLLDFGFGQRPGTRLPGETAGLLRQLPWYDIEHANISFGHGFSVSPLQMNMATAAIANGGVLMRPLLVLETQDASGNVIEHFEPTIRNRVVSEEAAHETMMALETVVENGGTATRAHVPGFRVAGKTGTAELYSARLGRYENEFLSSFTGFVPSDNPQFAITVMVVRPTRWIGYFGGIVAAPLFREIAIEALTLDGVFPEHQIARTLDGGFGPKPLFPGAVAAGNGGPETGDDAREGSTARDLVADAQGEEAAAAGAAPDGQNGAEEGGGALSAQADVGVPAHSYSAALVPDFVGMRTFAAMELATQSNIAVHLNGSGWVVAQEPTAGTRVLEGTSITLVLGHEDPRDEQAAQ